MSHDHDDPARLRRQLERERRLREDAEDELEHGRKRPPRDLDRPTKRKANRCGECNFTWFPRGADESLKCPHCGTSLVEITPTKKAPPPPLSPEAERAAGIFLACVGGGLGLLLFALAVRLLFWLRG